MIDVLFVGAGPVGLWTAIQTKLRNPELRIEMLEKHDRYQRSHVVQLNPHSFAGAHSDPRLQGLIREFKETPTIRTNALETKLADLASELGIKKRIYSVIDPEKLKAKVIIGADGAHSIVRKTIFNNEMSFEEDLKFVVEVKYEVEGKGRPLGLIKEVYPTLKVMGAIAQEHVGEESEGKTAITLRMFIDRDKFEAMEDATFKHPYTFENSDLIHDKVLQDIQLWMKLKEKRGEVRVKDSEKITVTRLGSYVSRDFVKVKEGRTYCLVGDAAFGVPFFRSLNNGLLEGTSLARSFRDLHAYSWYVTLLSWQEIVIAKIKSIFLSFILMFVQISSIVPWQVNYWSEADIQFK